MVGRAPYMLNLLYMSKTYSMAIVSLLVAVLPLVGFEVTDTGTLEQAIAAILALGIAADRLRKGDISLLGLRKSR